MAKSQADAHWPNLKRVYRPKSTLILGIKRFPPGKRLEAEFSVEVEPAPTGQNIPKKKVTKLALVASRDPVKVNGKVIEKTRKLESIEVNGEPPAQTPPEDAPWLKVLCCVRANKRWRVIPGAEVYVPGLPARSCFRVKGAEGTLDRPLQAPAKQRLSPQDAVHAGDVVPGFVRLKDPEYGEPTGFKVWKKVYPALNPLPTTGAELEEPGKSKASKDNENLGWVNPELLPTPLPRKWDTLLEHDCRPLMKVMKV